MPLVAVVEVDYRERYELFHDGRLNPKADHVCISYTRYHLVKLCQPFIRMCCSAVVPRREILGTPLLERGWISSGSRD